MSADQVVLAVLADLAALGEPVVQVVPADPAGALHQAGPAGSFQAVPAAYLSVANLASRQA